MRFRSHVPGADDSIHTSEIFHNAIKSSMPCAFLKSSPIDSLFFVTSASSPPWGRGPRINCGAVKAEDVAARLLDVDDLGSELCKLGANIGLRDQLPGANRADAF